MKRVILWLLFALCSVAQQVGTVKDGVLNIRSAPGTSGKVVGVLTTGAVVAIEGKTGKWYQIFPRNGFDGYVLSSCIKNGKMLVPTDIRGTPGGVSLGTLPAGGSARVLSTDGNWSKVHIPSGKGLKLYVHGDYLRVGSGASGKMSEAVKKATAAAGGYAGIKPRYGVLIYDATHHCEVWSQNADKVMPIASLTKMMTLVLAYEAIRERPGVTLTTLVPVSHEASLEPAVKAGLMEGSKARLSELCQVMMVNSSNDCAACVGDFIGGNKAGFGRLATEKARAMGMVHTKFYNANGLPNGPAKYDNVSTPRELLKLMKEVWKYPQTREWISKGKATITTGVAKPLTVQGHLPCLGKYGVDGIKTGYTNRAGSCVATHARTQKGEFYIVLLGCESAGVRNALLESIMKTLQ